MPHVGCQILFCTPSSLLVHCYVAVLLQQQRATIVAPEMMPCTLHGSVSHTLRGATTQPTHHMPLGWGGRRLHHCTINRLQCRSGNASTPAPGGEPSSSGDELLQERLVDVLRVQINQKEVEDFTEQKKQELTQVAEDVCV